MLQKILVVDIGGTHVKLMIEGAEQRQFDSGSQMQPKQFVAELADQSGDWGFDALSIGFPSPVRDGKVVREPKHLGTGWVGFDFDAALNKPTRIINDAAMQALGSYHGGRMLFLGLGTGLGSALALEGMLFPLELGDLPYRDRDIIENFLGIPGISRLGEDEWKREVLFAITHLKLAFVADYVVLGGGLIHRFNDELPDGIERGKNENAFLGGLRLWEIENGRPKWQIF
ncbi:MAG TPA: ROK family protein [Chthoniobacterales bacterium]|nr:ROK family protein [Chthoniobacterales bacterium]